LPLARSPTQAAPITFAPAPFSANGKADVGGLKLVSLAAVDFPDYDANDLPPELAKLPAIKPGSRGLK